MPTEANLTGDMSDWGNQIYDPTSTVNDANGNPTRTPFANNMIPAGRLDQGFLGYLQQTVPKPSGVRNGLRNQLDTTGTTVDQHEYSARFDHRFSAEDSVFFRWSGQDNAQDRSAGRQTLSSYIDVVNTNIGANWVHAFNPTSILQLSFARVEVERGTGNAFRNLSDGFVGQVGWNPDFAGGFRGGDTFVPNVGVAQFFGGGERIAFTRTSDTWQYKGDYTKIYGAHTFKFGAEYDAIGHFGQTNDHSNSFNNVGTAHPASQGNTGSPLASFLLNVPNAWSRRDFFKRARGGGLVSFFAQDSWKASQKLTINLGLRMDKTFLPQFGNVEENTVHFGNIDYNTGIYWLTRGARALRCAPHRALPAGPGRRAARRRAGLAERPRARPLADQLAAAPGLRLPPQRTHRAARLGRGILRQLRRRHAEHAKPRPHLARRRPQAAERDQSGVGQPDGGRQKPRSDRNSAYRDALQPGRLVF